MTFMTLQMICRQHKQVERGGGVREIVSSKPEGYSENLLTIAPAATAAGSSASAIETRQSLSEISKSLVWYPNPAEPPNLCTKKADLTCSSIGVFCLYKKQEG